MVLHLTMLNERRNERGNSGRETKWEERRAKGKIKRISVNPKGSVRSNYLHEA